MFKILIRSQDKNYLIDIQGAEIFVVGTEIRISRWVDHYDTLGEYSTNKKISQVLDMIGDFYNSCEIAKVVPEKCGYFNFVFQMPLDIYL